MKGSSSIIAALVVIAITVDFRSEGLPRPQEDDSEESFFGVAGFAFDGPAAGVRTDGMTSPRPSSTAATNSLPSSTTLAPTSTPNVGQCVANCQFRTTSEFNPVCGTDGIVYDNPGRLTCARQCGRDVAQDYVGPCSTSIRK